jgi:hypothetical protein
MRIAAFDGANTNEVMARAKALLAPLEAEFGIRIERTGISYSRFKSTLGLELTLPIGHYKPEGQDAEAFKNSAPLHGIPVELLGQKFSSRGKEYVLTGYLLGANKKPLKRPFTLLVDGAECAATESFVKKLLTEAGLLPPAQP